MTMEIRFVIRWQGKITQLTVDLPSGEATTAKEFVDIALNEMKSAGISRPSLTEEFLSFRIRGECGDTTSLDIPPRASKERSTCTVGGLGIKNRTVVIVELKPRRSDRQASKDAAKPMKEEIVRLAKFDRGEVKKKREKRKAADANHHKRIPIRGEGRRLVDGSVVRKNSKKARGSEKGVGASIEEGMLALMKQRGGAGRKFRGALKQGVRDLAHENMVVQMVAAVNQGEFSIKEAKNDNGPVKGGIGFKLGNQGDTIGVHRIEFPKGNQEIGWNSEDHDILSKENLVEWLRASYLDSVMKYVRSQFTHIYLATNHPDMFWSLVYHFREKETTLTVEEMLKKALPGKDLSHINVRTGSRPTSTGQEGLTLSCADYDYDELADKILGNAEVFIDMVTGDNKTCPVTIVLDDSVHAKLTRFSGRNNFDEGMCLSLLGALTMRGEAEKVEEYELEDECESSKEEELIASESCLVWGFEKMQDQLGSISEEHIPKALDRMFRVSVLLGILYKWEGDLDKALHCFEMSDGIIGYLSAETAEESLFVLQKKATICVLWADVLLTSENVESPSHALPLDPQRARDAKELLYLLRKAYETNVPADHEENTGPFREHCEQLLALVKKLEAKASSEEG
jgi:hypothetical protein